MCSSAWAQQLVIKSVNTTSFPKMSAEVRYSPNGVHSALISASDIRITDHGLASSVQSLTCAIEQVPALHICIILDFKNHRNLVVDGLHRLINQLPMPDADVAILSVYEHVQVIQDYSRDRAQVLASVNGITESPGLDLDRTFYSKPNGCIPFSEGRNGKTVIIFISDLHCPRYNLDENKLYADAQKNGMSIGSILLGTTDFMGIFARIADNTDGFMYGQVHDTESFDLAIEALWESIYGTCIVNWIAEPSCETVRSLRFDRLLTGSSASTTYIPPVDKVAGFAVKPQFIRRGFTPGIELDSTVSLIAKFKPMTITSITTEPPQMTATPSSMTIDTVASTTLRVRWLRSPSDPKHGLVIITTADCGVQRLRVFQVGTTTAPDPITLIVPNGGEEYVGGTTATMKYEGIADNVPVEASISIDKGLTWLAVGAGQGGSIPWSVPPTPSDVCLARIEGTPVGSVTENDSVLYSLSRTRGSWLVDPLDRWIVMTGFDTVAVVCDAQTMKRTHTLPIAGSSPYGSVASPANGEYIAIGADSGVVIIYDAATWVERRRLKISRSLDVPSVRVTPSGAFILVIEHQQNVAGATGITVFDSAGVMLFDTAISMNYPDVYPAEVHPLGTHIAWSCDSTLTVLRFSDLATSKFSTGDPGRMFDGIHFSPDGSKLAVIERPRFGGTYRSSVHIVDVSSMSKVLEFEPIPDLAVYIRYYTKLHWTSDGTRLIAGSHRIVVMDAITWKSIAVIEPTQGSEFEYFDVSPNEDFVVAVCDDSLKIYDIWSGALVGQFESKPKKGTGGVGVQWGKSTSRIYAAASNRPYNVFSYTFVPPSTEVSIDTSDALWRIVSPIPDLQVTRIDMGTVPMGSTRDSVVTAVLCNRGSVPLPVQSIVISSGNRGDFNIPVGGGAFTLAPMECRDIVVEFMPMFEGYREARATVKTDVGAFPDSIIIHGNGVRDGMSQVNDAIDFGRMPVGTTRDTLLVPVIRNSGSTSLRILSAVMAGPDAPAFTLLDLPTGVLASQSNAAASVRFRAGEARRHSAWIDVKHDGPLGTLRIHVFGEGMAIVPAIVGSATVLSECSQSVDTSVYLTNIGEGRMIVTNASIDAVSRFRLLSTPELPFTLWPGDTVRLRYQYSPAGASVDTASLLLHVEGYATNNTMRIPLRGKSSFTSFTIAPQSIVIANAMLGSYTDTVLTLTTNVSVPITAQLSATGSGVTISGASSITIPAGTQSIDIPLRCTAITDPTTSGSVVITSPVCTGNMSVPIFISTNSIPFGDTLSIRVADAAANIGDEFAIVVNAFIPPSVAAQIGNKLTFDLQWNASMALPTSPTLLQPLTLQGITASLPVVLDVPFGGGEVTLRIPSRALLGTDSLSALHINPNSLATTVPYVIHDGLLTVHGLCVAGGTMRRFDPLANAPIVVHRSVAEIVLDIAVREANTCRVTIMDVRGALVSQQPTLTRESTTVRCTFDTSALAHGRYVIVVERDGLQTSIPLVH